MLGGAGSQVWAILWGTMEPPGLSLVSSGGSLSSVLWAPLKELQDLLGSVHGSPF